jgi:superoxide dismutase, Cu-Zn family
MTAFLIFPSSGLRLATAFAAALALGACASGSTSGRSYIAVSLDSRSGSQVTGVVQLTRRGDRIRLRATVRGLEPKSEHGFHIHEKGDCSAADAMSTGGHFNPGGRRHGRHGSAEHHAGDLPSLKADSKGVARVDVDLSSLAWDGEQGIKGRALIVHAKPDDFTTQPTGNAGARVACAVIG